MVLQASGPALVPVLHLIGFWPLTSHLTSSSSSGHVNSMPSSNKSASCVFSLSSNLSASSDEVSASSPVTHHPWGELTARAVEPELVLVLVGMHSCLETGTLSSTSGQLVPISGLRQTLWSLGKAWFLFAVPPALCCLGQGWKNRRAHRLCCEG